MPGTDGKQRIGILCWEGGQVAKGLLQLETLVGNSTNPASYAFPIVRKQVKGANVHTILENPDREVLKTMIGDAKAMVAADGVKAITTSCGFNAVFQRELASALDVPVFTSSLLQVPFVQQIVGEKGEVAIITAHKAALKPEHLEAVGITKTEGLHVFGLENCPEWGKMFTDFDAELDLEKIKGEVVGVAVSLVVDVAVADDDAAVVLVGPVVGQPDRGGAPGAHVLARGRAGGHPPPLPRGGVCVHEHQQGVRRRAQRNPPAGTGKTLGVRRSRRLGGNR